MRRDHLMRRRGVCFESAIVRRSHPMEIRSARPSDAEAVSGLLSQLGFPADAGTVAARLEGMPRAAERVFVAAEQNDVLGLVTIHVTPVLHRPTPVGRITAIV